MKNKEYWKLRSLSRMDSYHKDADKTIGKVLEAYQASIDDINEQMAKIFNKYAASSKLSMDEAKQYLTTAESKEFLDNLRKTIDNVTDPDLKAEMLRQINAPAYRARLTKLQAMKDKLNIELKSLADVHVREMDKGLFSTADDAYYKTIFDMQQKTGLGFSFAEVPTNHIHEILKNNWSGKHYSKRIWDNTNVLASELEHTLTKGFMTGASVQRMSKEIADKMQIGQYAATRLIRTETTYVANSAELASYKEAGVDKLEFLATLDTRTSDICRRNDRKIILVKDAVPGQNIPPLHANCRSTTLEVFEDDNLAELQRRARDPVTGESVLVPGDMKYEDWYKKYVGGNQEAIVKEKMSKNITSDKSQYEKYNSVLGKDAPKSFDKFQELKYNNVNEWSNLKAFYRYKLDNPDSDKIYFGINKKMEELRSSGQIKVKGIAVKPMPSEIKDLNEHALQRMKERGITKEEAQAFINESVIAFKQRNGTQNAYYSVKGFTAISNDGVVKSTGYLDKAGELIVKEVESIVKG